MTWRLVEVDDTYAARSAYAPTWYVWRCSWCRRLAVTGSELYEPTKCVCSNGQR